MTVYSYVIESADRPGEGPWMPEPDALGTEEFDGTAREYAGLVLANWLKDADGDGNAREEDGLSRRVFVWAGTEQDHPATAEAVLHHWGPERPGDAISWRGESS